MKHQAIFQSCIHLITAGLLLFGPAASAGVLGSAGNFGALGGASVENAFGTATTITGDIGVYPGSSITNFSDSGGAGTFTGVIHKTDASAATAHADLVIAYNTLSALASGPVINLTGQDLGGKTLVPGVYVFNTSVGLTGTLTLDAQNDANARFVFLIGSTLTTASAAHITLINVNTTDEEGPDSGIYWVVSSSATLGTSTAFSGNIIASSSITLTTGCSIVYGRALAIDGSVTLDTNSIDASDANGGFGKHSVDLLLSFDIHHDTVWELSTINGSVPGASLLPSGIDSETVLFTFGTDSTVGLSAVRFTGPSGSGLGNTAAFGRLLNASGDYVYYVDELIPYLANDSIYSVDYDGTTYSGAVNYAPKPSDIVLLGATLALDDSYIDTLSWKSYAVNGTTRINIDSKVATLGVQLVDAGGVILYETSELLPSETSLDLSAENLSIYEAVTVNILYTDGSRTGVLKNIYYSSYEISTNDSANIFEPLAHLGGSWIDSVGTTHGDNFGWVCDLFFPWVYSASIDMLNNEGVYSGNGDGWIYVARGGNLADGFYLYRFDNAQWAWTNYNLGGWVYNFGTGTPAVGMGWVDITP